MRCALNGFSVNWTIVDCFDFSTLRTVNLEFFANESVFLYRLSQSPFNPRIYGRIRNNIFSVKRLFRKNIYQYLFVALNSFSFVIFQLYI